MRTRDILYLSGMITLGGLVSGCAGTVQKQVQLELERRLPQIKNELRLEMAREQQESSQIEERRLADIVQESLKKQVTLVTRTWFEYQEAPSQDWMLHEAENKFHGVAFEYRGYLHILTVLHGCRNDKMIVEVLTPVGPALIEYDAEKLTERTHLVLGPDRVVPLDRVMITDDSSDRAVFRVPQELRAELPHYFTRDEISNDIDITGKVYILGGPQKLYADQGGYPVPGTIGAPHGPEILAQPRKDGNLMQGMNINDLVSINGDINEGTSGSGVVEHDGKLVALTDGLMPNLRGVGWGIKAGKYIEMLDRYYSVAQNPKESKGVDELARPSPEYATGFAQF